MSTEANKAVVRNFEEQVWNQRSPGKIGEFFATNHVFHGPGMTIDFLGHQQMVAHFQSAFPDGVNSSDDMVAEGDKVVTRWTGRGKHDGDLMGIAPTGKQVKVSGLTLSRLVNGKVIEEYTNWDTFGMMDQLGVIPELAHA